MFEEPDAHVERPVQPSYLIGDGRDDVSEPRIATPVRHHDQRRTRLINVGVVGATAGRQSARWRPHSTLPLPAQRPERPSPREVHGAQPTEP